VVPWRLTPRLVANSYRSAEALLQRKVGVGGGASAGETKIPHFVWHDTRLLCFGMTIGFEPWWLTWRWCVL